jgi:2-succinyl-6-hydroxy-2,4-cyclohexadiene-1-carboxylate synthase
MMAGIESDSHGEGRVREWIRVREHGIANEGGTKARPPELAGYGGAEGGPRSDGSCPILLLHGFTGSADSWDLELLSSLAQGRRVLVVDLPGHGADAEIPDPARCGVESVVEGLCAVLDEWGIRAADWVGYSMGGRIALAAAVLRPERVRRLVLESASPGIEDETDRARRRCGDEELARAIEDRGIEWFVDYWMGLPLFATQGSLPLTVLRHARALRRRGRAEALAAAMKGLGAGVQPSYWSALHGVQVPTLLLTGELDHKYEEIGVRMAVNLLHCERRSIRGVGHAPHFEAPGAWVNAVREFLDRLP